MKNDKKITRFFAAFRMTSKRIAFTLAELPEAGQYRSKRAAFTLAEVLITLGIIGVVAAVTMPTLISNYQKKITATRLKQTYAVLWQAIKLSEAENGDIDTWIMPNVSRDSVSEAYEANANFTNTYILPFLKYSYVCSQAAYECTSRGAKTLSGANNRYINYEHIFRVMLSNGVVLHFWPRGNFVEIYIDINGASGPNISGKDLFYTIIRKSTFTTSSSFGVANGKNGLFFYGEGFNREYLKTKGYPCAKSGSLAGVYCGALIKLDGWEIKDDYPW